MQTAYTLATNSKTAKKGKRKVPKGKGQRAVQDSKALSPAAMVEIDHSHFRPIHLRRNFPVEETIHFHPQKRTCGKTT